MLQLFNKKDFYILQFFTFNNLQYLNKNYYLIPNKSNNAQINQEL